MSFGIVFLLLSSSFFLINGCTVLSISIYGLNAVKCKSRFIEKYNCVMVVDLLSGSFLYIKPH